MFGSFSREMSIFTSNARSNFSISSSKGRPEMLIRPSVQHNISGSVIGSMKRWPFERLAISLGFSIMSFCVGSSRFVICTRPWSNAVEKRWWRSSATTLNFVPNTRISDAKVSTTNGHLSSCSTSNTASPESFTLRRFFFEYGWIFDLCSGIELNARTVRKRELQALAVRNLQRVDLLGKHIVGAFLADISPTNSPMASMAAACTVIRTTFLQCTAIQLAGRISSPYNSIMSICMCTSSAQRWKSSDFRNATVPPVPAHLGLLRRAELCILPLDPLSCN